MSTAALFIIDPPERLDPPTDTTLAIMRESLGRGLRVYSTTLGGLALAGGTLIARARAVAFQPGAELFTSGPPEQLDMARDCALVWMRKDPPVDLAYLHATYLLDFLPPHVLQINPAAALRNICEKLGPARFPELYPATLVSNSPEDLREFLQQQGKIVIKPLEDCSGRGIVLLDAAMSDPLERLTAATAGGSRFVQGQRFLPEIATGDTRVLLLGGEILGWVRRVPAAGDFRSNVNAGGRCVPCELTGEDLAICARIGPWLRLQDIHLAGIDIVGGQVLEINITSPSCLREIDDIYQVKLEERILDYVLARV